MNWLVKVYYKLWHDIFGLDHPFTWYMRKSAKEHPLWWVIVPIVVGGGYYALVTHLWGLI